MENLNQLTKARLERLSKLEQIIGYLTSNGIIQHRQVLAKLVGTSYYHNEHTTKQRDKIWLYYNELDAFLEELALLEGEEQT